MKEKFDVLKWMAWMAAFFLGPVIFIAITVVFF